MKLILFLLLFIVLASCLDSKFNKFQFEKLKHTKVVDLKAQLAQNNKPKMNKLGFNPNDIFKFFPIYVGTVFPNSQSVKKNILLKFLG